MRGQDFNGPKPDFCRMCGKHIENRILFCSSCHKPAGRQSGTEKGGPYSPALYEATAPLRRRHQIEVDQIKEKQMRDATRRLQGALKVARADMESDMHARELAANHWTGEESGATEKIDAAKKRLLDARNRIPFAEKALRDAKKTLLKSECGLDAAANSLESAQKRTISARDAVAAAKTNVANSKSEVDMAGAAVPLAQNAVDAAKNALNVANTNLDSARSNLAKYQSRPHSPKSGPGSAGDGSSHAGGACDSGEAADAATDDASNKGEAPPAQNDSGRLDCGAGDAQHVADLAQNYAGSAKKSLSDAKMLLRAARKRLGAAQNDLLAARSRLSSAQSNLAEARRDQNDSREAKKAAKRVLADAQNNFAAAQRNMPSAELLPSAQRDLAMAEAEAEAARRRVVLAEGRMAAAAQKAKAAKILQDAEERRHQDGETRWAAERDHMDYLEQAMKDGERWASKPFGAAKILRTAEESLRAARTGRAGGIAKEAGDAIGLARRWMDKERDDMLAAEARLSDARRWVSDASGERRDDDGGKRWAGTQLLAFAREQKAIEYLRCMEGGWADQRERWAQSIRQDAARWEAFAEERDAEENQDAERRRQDADHIHRIDRQFNDIFESLERVPESGRTNTNMDIYREGIKAAKSYHVITKAGIRWPANLERLRSMTLDYHRRISGAVRDAGGMDQIREWLGGEHMPNAFFQELFGYGPDYIDAIRPWDGQDGIEGCLKRLRGIEYEQERDVRFAQEHPEVAQAISGGQMSEGTFDALGETLENMHNSMDDISQDAKAGVTPTMDRRTRFEEGTLVLYEGHLVLYDENGLKERERIPLDSVKSCETNSWGWITGRHLLSVEYGNGQKSSFHLPKEFDSTHSADEYAVWKYAVSRRLKMAKKYNASLGIHTDPPGAVVLVHGVPYGTSPLTLEQPLHAKSILAKKYKVEVRLEGHESASKHVPVNTGGGLKKISVCLKRQKAADPAADEYTAGYRRQLPQPPGREPYVREYALEWKSGTLVCSRDSAIILSADRRILLRIPYGALLKVKRKNEWFGGVQGLTVSYRREGGLEDGVYLAKGSTERGDVDAAYKEAETILNEKKREWSGIGSGFAPGPTRLPRSGYTIGWPARAVHHGGAQEGNGAPSGMLLWSDTGMHNAGNRSPQETAAPNSLNLDIPEREDAHNGFGYTTEPRHARRDAIPEREDTYNEFKETFSVAVRGGGRSNEIKMEVAIGVAAFANAKGGRLFVGVRDDRAVAGLGRDLKQYKNTDSLELAIRNYLKSRFGKMLDIEFGFNDEDYLVISVPKCKAGDWVYVDNEHFYVRDGNQSRKLTPKETAEYQRERQQT